MPPFRPTLVGLILVALLLSQPLNAQQREALQAEAGQIWTEAQALEKAGKLAEALAAGEKALAIDRRYLGQVHETIAYELSWLALRYERDEQFAAAKERRTEILAQYTEIFGKDHWKAIDARWALRDAERLAGWTAEQRGQMRETETLLGRVVELYGQGKPQEAVPLAEQVLAAREALYGGDHPQVANAAGWLAVLHDALANYARAEPLRRRAVEIEKAALGAAHPTYATSVNNLAFLYEKQAEYARAEPLFREALEIRQQTVDESHPLFATGLNNLAFVYEKQGDFARAEPLYRQALEITKLTQGETHPS
jgi:tetratricopeptide (TPR) repeat protein